jgi:hypothetical protein
MRTYQYTTFTVLDRYDTLYAVHKSDAGVGSGRRRRFLDYMDFASSQLCETYSKWNCVIPLFSELQSWSLNELGEFSFREDWFG